MLGMISHFLLVDACLRAYRDICPLRSCGFLSRFHHLLDLMLDALFGQRGVIGFDVGLAGPFLFSDDECAGGDCSVLVMKCVEMRVLGGFGEMDDFIFDHPNEY